MPNKNQREYKEITIRIKDKIIEASKKGQLYGYISENAISIEKDEDNNITHIIFANGGPIVYLDFDEEPGLIIAKDLDTRAHSAIPWAVWLEMRDELEENYVWI